MSTECDFSSLGVFYLVYSQTGSSLVSILGQPWVSFLKTPSMLFQETGSFTFTWNSPIWLGWPTNEPQELPVSPLKLWGYKCVPACPGFCFFFFLNPVLGIDLTLDPGTARHLLTTLSPQSLLSNVFLMNNM